MEEWCSPHPSYAPSSLQLYPLSRGSPADVENDGEVANSPWLTPPQSGMWGSVTEAVLTEVVCSPLPIDVRG